MRKKEFDSTAQIYLDRLLEKYFKEWEEKIKLDVVKDLTYVQNYKGELAKSFREVCAQRDTLIGCMQEVIQNQEELKYLATTLIKEISGEYPRLTSRITAHEE